MDHKKLAAHGFSAIAARISHKEHLPIKNARAILAVSSRNASAKAKRANPSLRKVKG